MKKDIISSDDKISTGISTIVSDIQTDEIAIAKKEKMAYIAERKKARLEKKKKSKLRPLPSLNVMKKRLMLYYTKRRNETRDSFRRLMSSPFELCVAIEQAREEHRHIKDFPFKDSDAIKDAYYKYFGHKHGVNSSQEN